MSTDSQPRTRRRTLHTRRDPYWHFRVIVSPEQIEHAGVDRHTHYAHRALLKSVEERGYTTHERIVAEFRDMDRLVLTNPDPNALHPFEGNTELTFHFPPFAPRVGDPARVDGGSAHGSQFEVEAKDQTVAAVAASGHYGPVEVYLLGFDTATGEWVYTPDERRLP